MPSDILEKFTSHLKNVLAKAYSLAVEMGSKGIQPEHLLLSLVLQKGSIGGEMLRKAHVSAEDLRRAIKTASASGTIIFDDNEASASTDAPKLSAESKRVIEKAVLTANTHEHRYVGTEHLLSGLLQIDSPAITAILMETQIDVRDLKDQVTTILKSTSKFPEITETFEDGHVPVKKGEAKAKEGKLTAKKQRDQKQKTPALDFFAIELTHSKIQEGIDPVFGREKEIERLIQVLCRRTKNNPMLIGEPGVGKTAIIEGLAKRIVSGDVPDVLLNKRIMSLDLGLVLAGTIYRGEFEGRIKQIIDEVKTNPDIILFIDEVHNIMGAGATSGSLDAANILKPALARGELHCIGATTLAEYKKHFEGDGALERRFQTIQVNPPTPDVAVHILKGLRPKYEEYHAVKITDEAIAAAVDLSERYITDRFLPDKAIDLIDEAAAAVRIEKSSDNDTKKVRLLQEELEDTHAKKQHAVKSENFVDALELKARERQLTKELEALSEGGTRPSSYGEITRRDIAAVIARSTGIPVNDLVMTDKDRLLKLEELLGAKVVGQKHAVHDAAELVRRAKAGIAHPNRPLATFLFLGPSGVGKTELAKTLAQIVFQDPDALVRIDMSEFSEGFSVTKLIGAPAGYVGYKEATKLTDVVKRKPHSLVLFDEIEKAHGDIHNLFLQILDDGKITDATGKVINFKNSIIVMTSNVGAREITSGPMGFSEGDATDVRDEDRVEMKSRVMSELEQHFRPEFINRIDKVIVFDALTKADLEEITDLQLRELAARISKEYGVNLTWKPKVLAHIAEKSWNPMYGARGVRRQIQELVESPLAHTLLSDNCADGDTVTVNLKGDAVTITTTHATATTKERQPA